MNQTKNDGTVGSADERELVVAYLSYALSDVGALSARGLRLLQLTIAAIAAESAAGASAREASVVSCH